MSRREEVHIETTIKPQRFWLNPHKPDASAFMVITGEVDIYEPRTRKHTKGEYYQKEPSFSGNIKISDCYKAITLDFYGEDGGKKLDLMIEKLQKMRDDIAAAKASARKKYIAKMTKKHGDRFDPETLELDWDAIEAEEKAKEKQKAHNKKQKDRAGRLPR